MTAIAMLRAEAMILMEHGGTTVVYAYDCRF